jgi:hypothetical protein
LWFEFSNDSSGLKKTAQELKGESQVAQAAPIAIDSRDPKPYDGVPCLRDFFHFHSSFGSNKEDFALGMTLLDFIGNGHRWMDMTSGSTS